MDLLTVKDLSKHYEKFTLDKVSFSLEQGYIMGFIGRNGAGKSTTLKSIIGMVHPDGGSISICGHDFAADELSCKQSIGFVNGEFDYFPKKKLSAITQVTKKFYPQWDDAAYANYLRLFELDDSKRVDQLSAGMRVKYALALALSHNAQLLILDEPTSGLDPVSRDDLLEVFQSIVEEGQRSILFSTHITSDLEKCADYITYIRHGRIIASSDRISFSESYRLVNGKKDQLTEELRQRLIGYKEHAFGFTGLMHADDVHAEDQLEYAAADLETIMIYQEKEAK